VRRTFSCVGEIVASKAVLIVEFSIYLFKISVPDYEANIKPAQQLILSVYFMQL